MRYDAHDAHDRRRVWIVLDGVYLMVAVECELEGSPPLRVRRAR